MIFTQVILEITKTEKKPNGAEKQVIKPVALPAKKERITQNRLDEFSMQGLKKVSRYSLNNVGEYEDEIFDYFTDEKGNRYKRTLWERDPKTNKIILEGEVANSI
ncbi:hypothetical protein [Lactococcus formosensis]|uniref:hypothetical protein n=1 Tax=Lactococcus formosensis TaxID=1281486 RepID=UPI0031FEE109